MKQLQGVSIFLPVFNEEKILVKHAMLLYNSAKKLDRPFEIVIVDDNSTDRTSLFAEKLSAKYAANNHSIRHVFFNNGPSRRENLAVAMTQAKYPITVFMDTDLSVNLEYLANLVLEMDKGYSVAIGSRYMGLKPHRELYRLTISRIYNKLWRILFKSKVRDHNCGFKAIKKDVLKKVVKQLGYDKQFVRGWFWDAELLIVAQALGYKIAEFPVTWDSGKQSSFNVRRELRMVRYILRKAPFLWKLLKRKS